MKSYIVTLVLVVAVGFSAAGLVAQLGSIHLPGNQQGYAPEQPIAFSHRLHAGELQIDCHYCHTGAGRSRHAGFPAASTCMNCHQMITAPLGAVRAEDDAAQKENRKPRPIVSPELKKLYDALALGEAPGSRASEPPAEAAEAKQPRPIEWIKVHNLPDHVYFNHSAHVNAGVACQRCHGAVETMERVYQVEDLSMGWCVNCHRDVNRTGVGARRVHASIDCVVCHH